MHIHIIGIAGSMTAPLAKVLKQQGHEVTGSDQEKIFPPISDILKNAKIPINNIEINKSIDLAVIGSSFTNFERTKKEYEMVKELNIPYISATQYVSKYLCKNNSVLVAGSYGKTTITSLLAWIFIKTNRNPSYMFGGSTINHIDSLNITDGDWSVVEADESIHGLDECAKFLYYPVKHLVLTSADWEHKDCYSSEEKNFQAFKKLVKNISSTGTLLINSKGFKTKELSHFTRAKVITYNSPDSDYYIAKTIIDQKKTTLIIKTPSNLLKLTTNLIGQFNFENILAAVALSDYIDIDQNVIKKSISSYKGIKRRLQLIKKVKNIFFYDDFAQSTTRIESTINAIKLHYPDKNIKVLFLPHASFLLYKKSLMGLNKSFKNADKVILGKLKFNPSISKEERVSAADFKNEIGNKLTYIPLENDIIKHFLNNLGSNDVVIYMSSGGIEGSRIIKAVINNLRKHV
jgi:UDP-N-acetylmuramate: L-alanyl-gamma-D-glutamyl-meso-diaminopimelate ligase